MRIEARKKCESAPQKNRDMDMWEICAADVRDVRDVPDVPNTLDYAHPYNDTIDPCPTCGSQLAWSFTRRGPWMCLDCEPPKTERPHDAPWMNIPVEEPGGLRQLVVDRVAREAER